ncbi:MAG: class I SAM-dependent methyltransferase [Patescibacteria group bacterium]
MSFSTGRALLDAQTILTKAGLTTGMIYSDFGSGTLGHFIFPASKIVGDTGKVFAVDILKSALEGIDSTARMYECDNIVTVWGDIEKYEGVGISSVSVDLISMINLSPIISVTSVPVKEARRVLKPGGTLLMVDWDPHSNLGPSGQEKLSVEDAVKIVEQDQGFKLLEKFQAGPYHWGAVFRKGKNV